MEGEEEVEAGLNGDKVDEILGAATDEDEQDEFRANMITDLTGD